MFIYGFYGYLLLFIIYGYGQEYVYTVIHLQAWSHTGISNPKGGEDTAEKTADSNISGICGHIRNDFDLKSREIFSSLESKEHHHGQLAPVQ